MNRYTGMRLIKRFSVRLCMVGLMSYFLLCMERSVFADRSIPPKQRYRHSAFCKKERHQRQWKIEHKVNIPLPDSTSLGEGSRCFSAQENLFFAALLSVQNRIQSYDTTWYDVHKKENRERAENICKATWEGRRSKNHRVYDRCITQEFDKLMGSANRRIYHEKEVFIRKRRSRAMALVGKCKRAFHDMRSKFPKKIVYPLAYHNPKIHVYPQWFIENRITNIDVLHGVDNIRASDIVSAGLGRRCTERMIWWLA